MVQLREPDAREPQAALTLAHISEAAAYVKARIAGQPTIGLVLGSGLGVLAEQVRGAVVLPYGEIPHFPRSTVPGHSGQLVIGELAGLQAVVMQGRAHYYEGHSLQRITLPIRVMQLLGARSLVVTNAAGGVNPAYSAGDLMAITDHINLPGMAGHHPLVGPNEERLGPRFPDLSTPYDPELISLLRAEAQALGMTLREGVYMMVSGPSFETPAEVRMIRALGADAVGMSTAPEVVVARHAGMRVLGISLITNVAVTQVRPANPELDVHQEVLETGQKAVPALAQLIEGFLRRLAATEAA